MDDAERAQAHEEMFRDIAQNHRKPTLLACRQCFYCAENIQSGLLFCNADCRDDYQEEQRVRQIMGRTQGHG